jgi:uncharacterized membrane-anchored protein YhcB (DUF1043 family)
MSELNNFDLYNNPELRKLDNPETKKDDDDDDDSPERLSKRQPEKKDKTKDDKEQAPKEKPELKHLKESEPADEKEAPLEDLGETERQEIVQELAEAKREEIEAELAELDPESVEASLAAEVLEDLERIETTGEIEAEASPGEAHETSAEDILPLDETEGEIPLTTTEETAEDDEATSITAYMTPQTASGSAGSGGGGTTPPVTPTGGAAGMPSSPAGSSRPFSIPSGPAVGTSHNPDMYSSSDVAYYERHAQNRGLLVGLIVGYLIGRRGGRIRTEKRLMPVQHKLEKEVSSLQEQLDARERKIRKLAYERLPEDVKAAERVKPLTRRIIEGAPERASRLGLEKPTRAERLGKTVIKAEAPLAVKPELRSIPPEQVKSMNHNELLLLSEKVVVEGASLRQIYEQHLIGERGLRRLLSEYLQGKDIRKDLREEMVEREIDFERDPMLRDAAMHSATGGGSGSTSLQQLLEKAGATATGDDALLPVARLQAIAKEEAAIRKKQQRQLFDVAMVTFIVVLAVAVVILFVRG